MRVAIMQPYFIPYVGYFRLIAGVDAFLLYDDVQFPRGGWVHRNRLRRENGTLHWLTLPLAYAPLGTLIRDLEFHPDSMVSWPTRCASLPIFRRPTARVAPLVDRMERLNGTPVDYLEDMLAGVADALGYATPILRTSRIAIPQGLKGEDRLIALCQAIGARHYLNAPGGRNLYAPETFKRHGMHLGFLPEHAGKPDSILQRLQDEPASSICDEINAGLARVEWLS